MGICGSENTRFAKIVNVCKPLTIFMKYSIMKRCLILTSLPYPVFLEYYKNVFMLIIELILAQFQAVFISVQLV